MFLPFTEVLPEARLGPGTGVLGLSKDSSGLNQSAVKVKNRSQSNLSALMGEAGDLWDLRLRRQPTLNWGSDSRG